MSMAANIRDKQPMSRVLAAEDCHAGYTDHRCTAVPTMEGLQFRVKEAREALKRSGVKATQEALAALLGVSRSAVANWESGVGVPDMENLINLALISGMGFEYLATGRGERFVGSTRIEDEMPRYMDEATARSADELQLLKRYRSSSEERKKAILALLR